MFSAAALLSVYYTDESRTKWSGARDQPMFWQITVTHLMRLSDVTASTFKGLVGSRVRSFTDFFGANSPHRCCIVTSRTSAIAAHTHFFSPRYVKPSPSKAQFLLHHVATCPAKAEAALMTFAPTLFTSQGACVILPQPWNLLRQRCARELYRVRHAWACLTLTRRLHLGPSLESKRELKTAHR